MLFRSAVFPTCALSVTRTYFFIIYFLIPLMYFSLPLNSSLLQFSMKQMWADTHTHTASPPLSPFVISPLFFLQAAQPDSIGWGTRTAPARVMLPMENLWLSPGEAFPYECEIRQRAARNGINMQKHGSWEKGRVVAGGRGREKRTSPPRWTQSVELEHHEHWKIYWMERYDHGKSGKRRTGSMSRETPTELEEEASVLGRYHLLMQRGLRAEAGVLRTQWQPHPAWQDGSRGRMLWWSEGPTLWGIKVPALSQENCLAAAAWGGEGVFASHHTSLLALISSPFLLTCSHLL